MTSAVSWMYWPSTTVQPFSPDDIAGLEAWFKFNTGVLASQWDDQTANARHLLQATPTNQPAVQVDGSLLFDGVDNFMKCVAFTLNQPCTYCLRFKQVTWTASDRICDGNAANIGVVLQAVGTPKIQVGAGTTFNEPGDLAVNTYGVLVVVFNGASSIIQVNNGTETAGAAGAGNPGGFTLGQGGAGAGPSNIQVKEILIYSVALDAPQRTNVYNYLNAI